MEIAISRRVVSNASFALGAILLLTTLSRYMLRPITDPILWIGLALGGLGILGGLLIDRPRTIQFLSGRQGRYGSNALVLLAAVLGILIVLNYLAASNPQQIDLTEDKEYTLAPESQLLLSELSDRVEIIGFYSSDQSGARDRIRPLLDQFVAESDQRVSYEFVDPISDPLRADVLGVTRDASLVVVLGDRSHVVDFPDESQLVSAVVRLSSPEDRYIYFLTGHGEMDLEDGAEHGLSQLRRTLESKNYHIEALNLAVEGEIPTNARAVVIGGPRAPIADLEIELLDGYLRAGGSLVALLEPSVVSELAAEQDSLSAYLEAEWSIVARDDFIVDLDSLHPFVGLPFEYGQHPVTERVRGFLTQFPSARSIEYTGEGGVTNLVSTSPRSWGETDFEALIQDAPIEIDEGIEVAGPLALAIAFEERDSNARILVIGDSEFASNGGFFVGANGDFMVNMVDWAAGEEDLIDITPRTRTQRQVIPPTRGTVLLLVFGTAILLPGAIVASGLLVWWQRRQIV